MEKFTVTEFCLACLQTLLLSKDRFSLASCVVTEAGINDDESFAC